MKIIYKILLLLTFSLLLACNKEEFLNKKPVSGMVVPKTLNDFQALLENTNVMNFTGGLAQLSSDDYIVGLAGYQSLRTNTQRNAHIWAKDIYGGEIEVADWNKLYTVVFYANAVLDGLEKSPDKNTDGGKYIRGWALFVRSYAFYDLIRNFCKAYDPVSSSNDPGIPLRLSSGIDYVSKRASLQTSLEQVFADLNSALELLPSARPSSNLNRPSKLAVYALLSRIYLDMRNYPRALDCSTKALSLYNTLIDYKTVDKSTATPFSVTNSELIYNTFQVVAYGELTGAYTSALARINPDLLNLYSANDMRFILYFDKRPDDTYTKKRGYVGVGSYPFTGLATDELYLIKAECLVREEDYSSGINLLNDLLRKRWDANLTNPVNPFKEVSVTSKEEALAKVLLERRKELVWRGLRWHDLKRLNKEGANITLQRTVDGKTYFLPPNDPRWVFPIPGDEISLGGIEQNER